eukprot:392475_1
MSQRKSPYIEWLTQEFPQPQNQQFSFVTNNTFEWNFTSITNDDDNISDWKWTNNSQTTTNNYDTNKTENTSQRNDIIFSWNTSNIDNINDNYTSIFTQFDESTELQNDFGRSTLNKNNTFVGLQNDNIYNKDWYFNLVCGFIRNIPLHSKTIVPIEIIQTCFWYFIEQNFKCLIIDLLTNIQMIKKYLTTINYDCQQNKSIQIDNNIIKQAYEIINDVSKLKSKHYKNRSKQLKKYAVEETQRCLLEQYYKLIPHLTKKMSLSNGADDWVKKEMSLIDALSRVSYVLSDPSSVKYNLLKCNIYMLPNISGEYKMIENYFRLTHDEIYKLKIKNIYKLENVPCLKPFLKWKSNNNRMLLCFGDKITNFCDILINGLISDKTYKYGKGICFSDMCCYAINKCCVSSEFNTGLVLLCQVVLDDKITTKYSGTIIPSKHSTLNNGCLVPCDKGIKRNHNRWAQYNEYVVHDQSQIKMEYLVQLAFTYPSWNW